MKITEVQQPSDRALFEAIDQDNNTGFKTEDLVRIVREESSNQWSKHLTAQELLELLSAGD